MNKPLQGSLFRKFRYQIMGVIPDQDTGIEKSQPGKTQKGKAHPGEVKPKKGKEYIYLSLVLPVGQHHRSVLGEVKNGLDGQTHAHTIFWSRTYIRLSSIRPMDGSAFTSYLQQLSLSYQTHF